MSAVRLAPARAGDAPLDSHWGLHLVEELADRWGVTTEPESTVWFELDRCRCADPRPAPDPRRAQAGAEI